MNKAPYMRTKDFDHEDVDTEFTADGMLNTIANVLASIGVFTLFLALIGLAMQIPSEWVEVVLLAVKGTV